MAPDLYLPDECCECVFGFLNDGHDHRYLKTLSLVSKHVSVNLGECDMLTDSALFALVRNCPLLSDIRMDGTGTGKRGVGVVEDSNSLVANPQVKSLNLGFNLRLRDESIKTIASVCPNLQMLDLRHCYSISEGIIVEVLRRCCKIRHLSLVYFNRGKLLGMKSFEVPNLEVLNLSYSGVDDETLYVISKSCCGLLQLDLRKCFHVTEKGVRLVVENCTHLRQISLRDCHQVADDVVAWMLVSGPSLRKIVVPSGYCPSDVKKELLLRHQCLLV